MDAPTRAIVDYTTSLKYEDLSQRHIGAAVRHVLDAVSCALGAFSSEPAEIARRIASTASSDQGASVFGLPHTTTPEYATFANTAMVRYLDYNDAGAPGHASDMISGVIAVAESTHAPGRSVVLGVTAAYEVGAGLSRNGLSLFDEIHAGVDQIRAAIGGAAGASKVLELTREQTANAISLALTPSVPLRVVRTGVISHWKGCATAHGTMNAVFGARLAKEGMTAPEEPFNGIDGFRRLTGIDVGELKGIGDLVEGRGAVEGTSFKYYPTEGDSQGILTTIFEMGNKIANVDDIERIDIAMYWAGWNEIGGGQGDRENKWHPTTRETADHSMPYLVAVALIDKVINLDSFTPERINDPALYEFMKRIDVTEDPGLTAEFDADKVHHAGWPTITTITMKNGEVFRERSTYPKGSPMNPMSDEELVAKYYSMAERVLSRPQSDQLLDTLWRLDTLQDVGELTALFRTMGQ
jgi:2-methylcitrate dehydratase